LNRNAVFRLFLHVIRDAATHLISKSCFYQFVSTNRCPHFRQPFFASAFVWYTFRSWCWCM